MKDRKLIDLVDLIGGVKLSTKQAVQLQRAFEDAVTKTSELMRDALLTSVDVLNAQGTFNLEQVKELITASTMVTKNVHKDISTGIKMANPKSRKQLERDTEIELSNIIKDSIQSGGKREQSREAELEYAEFNFA